MQVACPGCPTDTFRETLNPPNKVRLKEGEVPELAWRGLQGLTAEGGWGRRAPTKKKSWSKDPTRLSNPSAYIHTCNYILRT